METTEAFKSLAEWFGNYSNVSDAINILVEEGSLKNNPEQYPAIISFLFKLYSS